MRDSSRGSSQGRRQAWLREALVVGEGRPYLTALLVLNPEEWRRLADRYELDADDYESLSSEKLQQHLVKVVRRRLKDFPGYAKVRRVIPLIEPWSDDQTAETAVTVGVPEPGDAPTV